MANPCSRPPERVRRDHLWDVLLAVLAIVALGAIILTTVLLIGSSGD
jgi:hypothetical protein